MKAHFLAKMLGSVSLFLAANAQANPNTQGLHELFNQNYENVSGRYFSSYYTDADNYQDVYRNVMSWFKTTTNGCVAFASSALRLLGVNVPLYGNKNGLRISTLTKPFSDYLEEDLGWIRINNSQRLLPGDLVFTIDEPGYPGEPSHVFMHAGYADANRKVSWAVDNQDFTHTRALAGEPSKDYDAFAYALRSPAN